MIPDDPYYWTAVDHVRHHLGRLTWDAPIVIVTIAAVVLPAMQIATAAAAVGQGPVRAAATAAAAVALAATAAREAILRRRADTSRTAACRWLAAPGVLAAACALRTAIPTAPGRGPAAALLAIWPTVCIAGIVALRLTRPTLAGADTEPMSRSEPIPEPQVPPAEPQCPKTKKARLLALYAEIPADDPRGPTDLADDLAAKVGMHAATARRILAAARSPEPAGSPARALTA